MIKRKYVVLLLFSFALILSSCSKGNSSEGNKDNVEESSGPAVGGISGIVDRSYDYVVRTSTAASVVAIEDASVGDVVSFGSYEYDTEEPGNEEILWDVIDEKDGSLLLISHYVIEEVAFTTEKSNPGWGKSYVRVWLNNDFYNDAFTEEEKEKIILSTIDNPSSVEMFEMCGKTALDREWEDTEDYIFLLSWEEAFDYYDIKLVENADAEEKHQKSELFYSANAVAMPSPYLAEKKYEQNLEYRKENGYDTSKAFYPKTSGWLLRSDHQLPLLNMMVSDGGVILGAGTNVEYGIRPVMWIKVEE